MQTIRRIGPLAVLAVAGLVAYGRWPGGGPPLRAASRGEALGRAYAPVLAATYADGWFAAAAALEEGKSVAEAQEAFQTTWQGARARAFRAHVRPALARVLPEGAEPADAAARAKVVALWRDFARGLKNGR